MYTGSLTPRRCVLSAIWFQLALMQRAVILPVSGFKLTSFLQVVVRINSRSVVLLAGVTLLRLRLDSFAKK